MCKYGPSTCSRITTHSLRSLNHSHSQVSLYSTFRCTGQRHASTKKRSAAPGAKNEQEEVLQDAALNQVELVHQFNLRAPSDVFRRMLLGHKALNRAREMNKRLLKSDILKKHPTMDQQPTQEPDISPETDFRDSNVDESVHEQELQLEEKTQGHVYDQLHLSNRLLMAQVSNCLSPKDFQRLFAVASQNPKAIRLLAVKEKQRRLAGHLARTLSDNHVLSTLNIYLSHFKAHHLDPDGSIIWLALRKAASCTNWSALRRWLPVLRKYLGKRPVESKNECEALAYVLRDLHEGLEKSRNLSKPDSNQAVSRVDLDGLHKCLLGSEELRIYDSVAFKSFIPNRIDLFGTIWDLKLHRWIRNLWVQLLALCQSGSTIVTEWEEVRSLYRAHFNEHPDAKHQRQVNLDLFRTFVLPLFQTGHSKAAWDAFSVLGGIDDGHKFRSELSPYLVEHLHELPRQFVKNGRVEPRLERYLLAGLKMKLEEIEKALDVTWVQQKNVNADEPTGLQGYHHFSGALKLANPDKNA